MKKTGIFLVTAAMLLDTVAPAMAAFEWTNDITREFTVYEDFSGSGAIKNKADWEKIGPRGPSYNNGILSFGAAAGDEKKNTTATRTFDQISSENTRFAVVDLDFRLTTKAEGMIFNVAGSTHGDSITVINTTLTNGKLELWTDAGTSNQAGNHFTLIDDVETNRWYSISLVYDLENMKTDYYIDNIIALNDKNYYKNRQSEALGYLTLGNIMNSEATFDIRSIKIGALTDKLAMHYDSYYTSPSADDWDNITSLTLPTTTKYGSTVTWTSSDTDIIANNGTINTSNALVNGSEVTLTESYSKGGSTYSRTYDATVYGSAYDSSWTVCDFFNANSATSIDGKTSDTGNAVWSKAGYGMPTYSNGVLTIASSTPDSMEDNADSDSRATLNLAEDLNTNVSVEVDIKIAAACNTPMIYFNDSNGANFARIQGAVRNSVTNLYVYNGNANKTALVTDMTAGTWYSLKTVFDFVNQKVDYYVNGTSVYSDYSFYKERNASGLGEVMIGATNKTGTTANVRNLIITGTAEAEEDGTEAFTFTKTANEFGDAKIYITFQNDSQNTTATTGPIDIGTEFSGQGDARLAVVITGIQSGYSVKSCVIE